VDKANVWSFAAGHCVPPAGWQVQGIARMHRDLEYCGLGHTAAMQCQHRTLRTPNLDANTKGTAYVHAVKADLLDVREGRSLGRARYKRRCRSL